MHTTPESYAYYFKSFKHCLRGTFVIIRILFQWNQSLKGQINEELKAKVWGSTINRGSSHWNIIFVLKYTHSNRCYYDESLENCMWRNLVFGNL